MENAVLLSGARTPIGAFNGAFAAVDAVKLGAVAIRGALARAGVAPDEVDDVILGMVLQGGAGQAPARQAALKADIPEATSAWTVNKVCSSGLKAVMAAAGDVMLGESQVVVAGGMENMSKAPYLLSGARSGYRYGNGMLVDMMLHDGLWDPYSDQHMGSCAEICAAENKITREDQDEFALRSYARANGAIEDGLFREEIEPVEIPARKGSVLVETDEEPGRGKPEKIPALRPAFKKDGTVTAANASSINDGAAALVVASESWAKANGKTPLARIVGWATHSQKPEYFTTAPRGAIRKLLEKIHWSVDDVDAFEINEAFSVVSIYNNQALGLDANRVNIRGGAVALGHPIGASGARVLVTLLHILKQEGRRRGVASLCNGGGEATAMAVEMI